MCIIIIIIIYDISSYWGEGNDVRNYSRHKYTATRVTIITGNRGVYTDIRRRICVCVFAFRHLIIITLLDDCDYKKYTRIYRHSVLLRWPRRREAVSDDPVGCRVKNAKPDELTIITLDNCSTRVKERLFGNTFPNGAFHVRIINRTFLLQVSEYL